MQRHQLSILFLLCLLSVYSFGKEQYQPKITDPMLEPWRYVDFPELNGKGVRCMTSTSENELYWFGLDSGVVSYNGYDWHYYGKKEGLTGTPVQQLFSNNKGEVYAGTAKGLYLFSNNEWQPVFELSEKITLSFQSISQLKSGTLVCGTNLGAFLIQDKQQVVLTSQEKWKKLQEETAKLRFVEIPNELLLKGNFQRISDIFELTDGQLWLATTFSSEDEIGDIMMFSEKEILSGKTIHYNLLSRFYSIKLGYEQKIFRESNGNIWIINKSNKVPTSRFSNGKWQYIEHGAQFGNDEYSEAIIETADGKIWIAGIGNLYCLNRSGQWSKYDFQTLDIPQGHLGLHSGNGTDLWIFGYQSEVSKIDLSTDKWLSYLDLNFQGNQQNGTEWFLNFEGDVIQHQDNNWKVFNHADGLMDAPVSLFITSNDIVWAIGSDQEVSCAGYLKDGKWTNFHFDSLSWGVDYRAFYEAKDGSIWIGGSTDVYLDKGQNGGVLQIVNPYEKDKKVVYHKPRTNGLNQLNAYGITQSANGYIWIGGSRLCYYDGSIWQSLDNKRLDNFVNTVHSDSNGKLFVGTRQYGLYIYEQNEWKNYYVGNGLISNNIISIATDDENNAIWLATDKDFSFYNGETWINNIFPKDLTLSYEGGALVFNHKNEVWVNKSLREWKRRIYTGKTPRKSIRDKFVTYRFIKDNHLPETSIDIYSDEVDYSGNNTVFWSGRHFFNKSKPSELYFSFQLNDGNWSSFSKKDNHTFIDLPDGDYTFRVRAMDQEGNVDPTPATVSFTVKPPIWKQGWFLLLIATFLITVAFFQFQILKKRKILEKLNLSLQDANSRLESSNKEIAIQRDNLGELVEKNSELTKAKLRFFTNITHEFRTPLSLILGPIEQLLQENGSDSQTSVTNSYNLIKKNALRLHRLINQLLEIRRIESGSLELNLQKDDLVRFVSDTKSLFHNKAAGDSISLFFHSEYKQLSIYFDQDKVEKILFNLLSNAFKHTLKNGKISIKLLKPDTTYPDYFRIMVEDSGQGIDEEIQDLIFDRFTVGNKLSSTDIDESSGIGLSYIKDLIEFHKGHIRVSSKKGIGSTFTVYLPDHLKPSTETDGISDFDIMGTVDANIMTTKSLLSYEIASNTDGGELPTLLIVEDHKDMRFFIANLLDKQYRILTAEDGSEGLKILEDEDVDLVISDIMMPEVDGITFCERVKSNPVTSHIPVILLTALAMDEKRIMGYESGADSYIVKPFKPELLNARVKNLLEARDEIRKKLSEDLRFRPKEIRVTSMDEQFMEKLASLIDENISNSEFDVSTMCEMMNMSHMHFIRKVKQLTGKKPIDLLKHYRITRAKQLLEQNKLNISEVSYMVGYDLPNSFARAFKKEVGISPTQFIQENASKTVSQEIDN
ncbi:response regulator [Limibacter armeniacum]|uniref:hybrid sensor histidine kinase/response regulator transcription factor n=1 Tax=Limibacter armeniacum TaxID=466084 RepID=UPI002FE58B1D